MSSPGDPAPAPPRPHRGDRLRKGPVKWLLGREVLLKLKWMVLYAIVGDRIGGKDWMTGEPVDLRQGSTGDAYWFDYLADTGDAHAAAYTIACLCLDDLHLEADGSVRFARIGGELTEARAGETRLERGSFLFVGGDTAYHVADYRTLVDRFQYPFDRAFHHTKPDVDARPVFGLPGNHDYYDALDGFNRQFRKPAAGAETLPAHKRKGGPELALEGFYRLQSASYVALLLPFGWTFLGLDAQDGKADIRQLAFFENLLTRRMKKRLIIATPEPHTVFATRPRADDPLVDTLHALGLPCPYLAGGGDALPDDHCRLDLAGDAHHYARYGPAESAYLSVVSGLGGAFMQASHTFIGDFRPDVVYPAVETSRAAVNRRLFSVVGLLAGGNLLLVGLLVWSVVRFASFGGLHDAGAAPVAPLHEDTWRVDPGAGLAFAQAFGGLAVAGAALALAARRFRAHRTALRQSLASEHDAAPRRPPAAIALAVAALAALGVAAAADATALGPVARSGLLFLFTAAGLVLVRGGLWYGHTLEMRARKKDVSWVDDALGDGLALAGAATVVAGFARFGGASAALTAFHFVVFAIVALLSIGFVAVAVLAGANRHDKKGKALFAAFGVWHSVTQLGTPWIWARHDNAVAIALAAALLAVLGFVGYRAAASNRRWLLAALWVVAGVGVNAIAFAPVPTLGLEPLGPAAYFAASLFAAATWLGWYLAVGLAFDGHNNEVGAATRIGQFKQLIRFKLTRDRLEGFVIAVDEPEADRARIRARLVDRFVVRPRPGP